MIKALIKREKKLKGDSLSLNYTHDAKNDFILEVRQRGCPRKQMEFYNKEMASRLQRRSSKKQECTFMQLGSQQCSGGFGLFNKWKSTL